LDDLISRLRKLDSCAVSDALDSLSLPPAVSGIKPQSVSRRIAGNAVTVKLVEKKQEGSPVRHLCTAAIDKSNADNIIVIEQKTGLDAAGWGGVLSNAAKLKGVSGVIVEGPARDIDEASELDFPVYARYSTARTARGRIYELDFNIEVKIGEIFVQPGALVMADMSGVVVIPKNRAEEVLSRAERIVSKEKLMTQAVIRGEPVSSVMGVDYEKMLGQ